MKIDLKKLGLAIGLLTLLNSCSEESSDVVSQETIENTQQGKTLDLFNLLNSGNLVMDSKFESTPSKVIETEDKIIIESGLINALNDKLRENNIPYAIPGVYAMTNTKEVVIAPVGAGTDFTIDLPVRWVPKDSRRGSRENLTYYNYVPGFEAKSEFPDKPLQPIDVAKSIAKTFDTWNNVSQCDNVSLDEIPFSSENPVPSQVLTSIFPAIGGRSIADINVVGFLESRVFNFVASNNDPNLLILGYAFPLVFINPDGTRTDIDNDGKEDLSHYEIFFNYGNERFSWTQTESDALNFAGFFDVETVALHEVGHAMGKGHFGVQLRPKGGAPYYDPKSVMNASIIDPQRELSNFDNSAHCVVYGAWPYH